MRKSSLSVYSINLYVDSKYYLKHAFINCVVTKDRVCIIYATALVRAWISVLAKFFIQIVLPSSGEPRI